MKKREAPVDDLRERFILWLASKPADLAYVWRDGRYCACGTFISEVLSDTKRRWYWPWAIKYVLKPECYEDRNKVWARWNSTANVEPHTYGALLGRVRD